MWYPGIFLCWLGMEQEANKRIIGLWNVPSKYTRCYHGWTSTGRVIGWCMQEWFLSNIWMAVKSGKKRVNLLLLIGSGLGPGKGLECVSGSCIKEGFLQGHIWTLREGTGVRNWSLSPEDGTLRAGMVGRAWGSRHRVALPSGFGFVGFGKYVGVLKARQEGSQCQGTE